MENISRTLEGCISGSRRARADQTADLISCCMGLLTDTVQYYAIVEGHLMFHHIFGHILKHIIYIALT